jgi:hypothetical protein
MSGQAATGEPSGSTGRAWISACIHGRASTVKHDLAFPFSPSRSRGFACDELAFAGGKRIRARLPAFQPAEPAQRGRMGILLRPSRPHAS